MIAQPINFTGSWTYCYGYYDGGWLLGQFEIEHTVWERLNIEYGLQYTDAVRFEHAWHGWGYGGAQWKGYNYDDTSSPEYHRRKWELFHYLQPYIRVEMDDCCQHLRVEFSPIVADYATPWYVADIELGASGPDPNCPYIVGTNDLHHPTFDVTLTRQFSNIYDNTNYPDTCTALQFWACDTPTPGVGWEIKEFPETITLRISTGVEPPEYGQPITLGELDTVMYKWCTTNETDCWSCIGAPRWCKDCDEEEDACGEWWNDPTLNGYDYDDDICALVFDLYPPHVWEQTSLWIPGCP